jgi:DNA (cytosine-5)-methyltransferase 1
MKIKFSNRGLTFSFKENDTFQAGVRYRYVVDNKASQVLIIPDENGKYKFSKKGAEAKPLVDLRNEEIRQAMSMARYMEVEILPDKIIVHIIKTNVNFDTLANADITDLIDKSDKVTFSINKDELKNDSSALAEMLETSGLFDRRTRSDICYTFDTVSLFSGAGLLDYHLAQDDAFDILYALDKEPAACETYRHNVGDHIVCGEIQGISEKSIPDCELIAGGICCQPYSNMNRVGNEKLDTSKKNLIYDYIRMVKAKNPWMFVIENVPQFITEDNGKWLNVLLTELSPDYNITYSVVNDADLGGYTMRRRMVLIGSMKAMGKVVIPDVHISEYEYKTAGDALRKVTPKWPHYYEHPAHNEETIRKMSLVRPGNNFKDIPESRGIKNRHSNSYRRLDADKPAVTLAHPRKTLMMPPVGNRSLTVAESAALMGLDENFRLFGNMDKKYQQLVNGVTKATALFIKEIVKDALYRYADSLFMPRLLAA